MWKDAKRDECCDLYERTARKAEARLRSAGLKETMTSAIAAATALPKAKGAVTYRKSFDKLLGDMADVSRALAFLMIYHACMY